MPAITKSAPGKIILLGEHSVVYGRPAIAVPVEQVRARTIVIPEPRAKSGSIRVDAPDINLNCDLLDLPDDHPLRFVVSLVSKTSGVHRIPACTIRITSSIPLASGMGSGAAVTVSLIRAISGFIGYPITDDAVNELTFEVEKLFHGTPSGIDNTVITYARPIYYQMGLAIELLEIRESTPIIIGDTGISSPTAIAVGDLRQAWQSDSIPYERLFDQVGELVKQARSYLEDGDFRRLGYVMSENHAHLQQMGVSSGELDHLVNAAMKAGALGAKLSGGGRGGNMIALVSEDTIDSVAERLRSEGAANVIVTWLHENQTPGGGQVRKEILA